VLTSRENTFVAEPDLPAPALRWTPSPTLRDTVVRLTGYAEPGLGPASYVELPPNFVAVVFSFGSPYRVRAVTEPPASALPSFVGGLGDRPVVVDSDGDAACVQVDLTPLAAARFLRVPMYELAGRAAVPLVDVLGRDVDRLEEQLAGAADWETRRRLAESFLAARLEAAPPTRPDAAFAWRRLAETGGRIRVGALAAELGCSSRHLARVFRHDVGLSPKAAARLMRFNRARSMLADGVGGADVAARCGYTDQSHLVAEFRRFAGAPPSAVRFLQDASAAVA
jgi:AraC-like DNA-binding protein